MTRRMATSAAVLGLQLTLSSCLMGPRYTRPAVRTPAGYRGESPGVDPGVANLVPLGEQKWNTVFTDPVLQKLIAAAMTNNYDVKLAADRILEQMAQVGVTRSAEFPTISVGVNGAAIGLPSGLLSGNSGNGGNGQSAATDYYAMGLTSSASWSLDFWGYYRRQTEAARALLRANEWALQATYSTLVENVATSYYQLRSLDAQLQISRRTLASRQESLDLNKRLEEGGSGTLADVRQAEELYYTALAQIPDLEGRIEQQENSLKLLLGEPPGPLMRGQPINEAPHPPVVPVGLPSQLLERRADIRRAEALLIQANANIGVARAAYFPQFSLSSTAGAASSQLKGVVDSKNAYYYATATISQTIFDGGKIRNNYKLAKANHKELLDTYQQTIAGALRDVSNALVGYRKSHEYRLQQEKQTAASADAVRLAKVRYEAGATSFLEVLTNDANLYSSQLTLEAAQQQEALSLVTLYNALGGGW